MRRCSEHDEGNNDDRKISPHKGNSILPIRHGRQCRLLEEWWDLPSSPNLSALLSFLDEQTKTEPKVIVSASDGPDHFIEIHRSIPIAVVGFVDPLLDRDCDVFVREKQETADHGGCAFADDVTDMIPSDPNEHRQQSG